MNLLVLLHRLYDPQHDEETEEAPAGSSRHQNTLRRARGREVVKQERREQ